MRGPEKGYIHLHFKNSTVFRQSQWISPNYFNKSSLPHQKKKNRRRPESPRRPGAERGIRTLERVLTVTRFPIVRLRPTQPSLHPYLLVLHQQHWLL